MNALTFPGCLLPIGIVSFFVFVKYRRYKKDKMMAYKYLYGKKEYNNYLQNKKDNTHSSVIKYKELKRKDIKKAIWNRQYDLNFRYEYGEAAFRKLDSYRKGCRDFSEKEIEKILEMEREIKHMMRFDRSVREVERYIED